MKTAADYARLLAEVADHVDPRTDAAIDPAVLESVSDMLRDAAGHMHRIAHGPGDADPEAEARANPEPS